MSILQSASRCIQLLEGLTVTTSAQLRQELENTIFRFGIWVGDVGIFAPGIASIEYRLQDKSEVLDVMLVLLDQLRALLENAILPPFEQEKSENEDSSQTVENHSNSFDTSSTLTFDFEESNKSFGWTQDAMTKANTILGNLYHLSAALERSDSPKETSWVKAFIADEANIAEQEQRRKFASYVRDHLLEHLESIVLRPLLETETIKDVRPNARPSTHKNSQGFITSPRSRLSKLVLPFSSTAYRSFREQVAQMPISGQAYCYSPFTFRLIRVLDMYDHNVKHSSSSPLQGRLREISLDSPDPFDALSYVWENDSSTLNGGISVRNHILLDGEPGECRKPLEVSKNCYVALQNLRDHHGVRTIWVDAICIDQKNNSEKNMQIPLMKEIYGKARKVYIWLGESKTFDQDGIPYTSEYALEYLRQISSGHSTLMDARLSGFPANMHPQQIARASRVLYEAAVAKWFPSPAVSINHESLKDLIDRKWFRRMWTIQELVMAGEPFVVCGRKSIRWNRFFWGLILTRERTSNDKKPDFKAVITTLHGIESFWIEITKVLEHRQSKHWDWVNKKRCWYSCWENFLGFMVRHGKKVLICEVTLALFMTLAQLYSKGMPINTLGHFFGPYQAFLFTIGALTLLLTPQERDKQWKENLQKIIVSMLHSCRDQDATNPKDKVYAIYGLLKSFEIELPRPKYEDWYSLEVAYTDFAKAIIQWQGSLEILLEATGPWGSAPSWVPNWSRPYKRPLFSNATATGAQGLLGSRKPFQFSSDGRRFEVLGQEVGIVQYRLEVITKFQPLFWKRGDLSTRNLLEDEVSQELFESIRAFYVWFRIAMECFAIRREEITKFIGSNVPQDSTYTIEDADKWINLILNCYLRSSLVTEGEATGVHPGRKVVEMFLHTERLLTMHLEICQFFAGCMTLFISKATVGFVFGIGPGDIRKNDQVLLLSTLRTPIIARAKKSKGPTRKFEVIGAALVDGMMEGQYWPKNNKDLEVMLIV